MKSFCFKAVRVKTGCFETNICIIENKAVILRPQLILRYKKMRHLRLLILLSILLSQVISAQESWRSSGKSLYHDDFGGNNPDDPMFYSGPNPHIESYTNTNGEYMSPGSYIITKKGYVYTPDEQDELYRDNLSYWRIIDDHTYPNDFDRGYFLEIDGLCAGYDSVIYAMTIDNLDLYAGQRMSVSAYFHQIAAGWGDTNSPEVELVLLDETTGQKLTMLNYKNNTWVDNDMWNWKGVSLNIPEGVSGIRIEFHILGYVMCSELLSIHPIINDIAVDDIEARICAVPTIQAPDIVCEGTKNSFLAQYEDDGCLGNPCEIWQEIWPHLDTISNPSIIPFYHISDSICSEPFIYQWYFSQDSITWKALSEGNGPELKLKALPKHAGWYKVQVCGKYYYSMEGNCVISDPFKLFVIDDCPPIQCEDGVLLFRDDFGGEGKAFHNTGSHEALYSTTIEDLCAGSDLSFIAHISRQRLLFRLTNADTGEEVGVYETGDIPFDTTQPAPQWHQVGMNYRVQEGVSRVTLTIYNNAVGNAGNDFTIADVEIRLCLEPVTIKAESPVCRKKPYTLQALYENYGILDSPEYQWLFSTDSLSWSVLHVGPEPFYTIPVVHKSDEGWYRVTVAEEGNSDKVNCRTVSKPFRLQTMYCNTAVAQSLDTTVCDTLKPVMWCGHEWTDTGVVHDTLRDIDNDDSVYRDLTLNTETCCPDVKIVRMDSVVCDTVLPFVWFFRDTMLVFTTPEEKAISVPHRKWETCDDSVYTLALHTFYCEKLYPIVINKYNWQLLLDNVAFRRIFPDRQPATFQWYKDSRAIPDATNETYSEEKELMGAYQLAMTLDNGLYVKSNIIHIRDTVEPEQVVLRIYNSSGMLVGDPAGAPGFYLYHYRQGDRVWTEKKIIR